MPMLGDESELHRASLAKNAAAFFRMSRSARSLAFSLRSRSISSCSGFSWPWPGKACIGSALSSFAQRRSMFSSISRSRAACATLTPRSRISRTASTLNSRANTRLPMGHLQLQQSPFLGVHETGSRPPSQSGLSLVLSIGLDGEVPDHSTFSKNRHGRFRESGLLRKLFETVVARCMKEGIVGGEAFAVDASIIVADAHRRRGVAKVEDLDPTSSRAVAEHLSVLDDAAFGGGAAGRPKAVSPNAPAAPYTDPAH